MPRTARLTDALRSRRGHRALLFVGSAAALIGAGGATAASASAATVAPPAIKAPASAQAPVLTGKSSGQSPIVTTAAQAPALTPAAGSAHTPVAHAAGAPTTAALTTGALTTGAHTIAAHTIAATGHTQSQHAAAPAAPAAPAKPYEMYDSVTPSAIPAGAPMATYADGPYAASTSQVSGHSSVTWIDTNGSDPRGASVLDVEPGDATPQMAATWAGQHLDAHPHSQAVIYTMLSDWPATQQAISGLPAWQQHNVRYWIADPTGVRHLVPGSSATQWYWGTNYDISTVAPGF